MKQSVLLLLFMASIFIARSQDLYVTHNNLRHPEANLSFTATILPAGDAAFVLQLENPQQKKLQIWIRHADLGTGLDTVITKQSYNCRYNLVNADDGKYIISIRSGKERYTREIEMKTTTTVQRNVVLRN